MYVIIKGNKQKRLVESMKILHTGDLHLDSPFSTLQAERGEQAKRELRTVFSDIIAYVKNNSVDLLLISGDLFDSGFATRETAALLADGFEKAGCPVVIAPGNHDPFDENSIWKKRTFSDNVHIFASEQLSYFDFEELGARVYGYAFTSQYMKGCPIETGSCEGDKINILCAHGDTASPLSQYCPIAPAAISDFGADYTALGHIHSPEAANDVLWQKELSAAYCGCPQGRDFGECGVKGAWLVEIEKNGGKAEVNRQFVPFSLSIYEDRELKVDGAETAADIISELRTYIDSEDFGENTHLRITLCGYTAPGLVAPCDEIEEQCKEGLLSLTVVDETVPQMSSDELECDRGIRGEVYRMLIETIENGTHEERKNAIAALRYALAALSGESI